MIPIKAQTAALERTLFRVKTPSELKNFSRKTKVSGKKNAIIIPKVKGNQAIL